MKILVIVLEFTSGPSQTFIFRNCTAGNCLTEGSEVRYEKSYDDRKGNYRAANVTGGVTQDRQGVRTIPPPSSDIATGLLRARIESDHP